MLSPSLFQTPKQYTSPLLDLQTLFRLLLQPGGDVGDVGSK